MSLEPILDEDTTDVTSSPEDTVAAEENRLALVCLNIKLSYNFPPVSLCRLEFYEHVDYKQDKSLSSVRLVCKNATKVLRRKDSSGCMLKDGFGSIHRSDFT